MKILIAAPIRNRAWILPEYLSHLERLEYPKDKLAFHFVLNDSTDGSKGILQTWKVVMEKEYRYVRISEVNFNYPPDLAEEGRGRERNGYPRWKYSYKALSALRNLILNIAWLDTEADYLFSIDSDILVKPDVLNRLLEQKKEMIAALVKNDKKNAYNFLPFEFVIITDRVIEKLQNKLDTEKLKPFLYKLIDRDDLLYRLNLLGYTEKESWKIVSSCGKVEADLKETAKERHILPGDLFKVKTTGAVVLIFRRIFSNQQIRYFPGKWGYGGEDEGFCTGARKEGFESWVLSYLQEHIMDRNLDRNQS